MSTRIVLRNGVIHTPDHPTATAIGIADQRIQWIGDEPTADAMAPDATQIVDIGGAAVTPAFVDAHAHLADTGMNAAGADLRHARTRHEALQELERYAARSDAGVLLGHGWDDTRWPDGRFTRAELDRVFGDRIGYVTRVDAHSAVISTALLDRAPAIAAAPGWHTDGWVQREALNHASTAVDALIGSAQRRDAIANALRHAASVGIASVHELGAPHLSRLEDLTLIRELAAGYSVPDVRYYWGARDAYAEAAAYGVCGLAGDLCCDGAIGSRTAALHDAYADAPAERGHLYLDRGEIAAHVIGCTEHGLQAGFHAIGDRALDAVLGGFSDAADHLGTDAIRAARHRIEHAELLLPSNIATMSRLGLYASVQPAFDAAWGGVTGMYEERLGAERAARMNPYAELAEAGVTLAFGSDTPVTPFAPWDGVRAALDHQSPKQRIGVADAFTAHTVGGWRAARVDTAGELVVGAPATFAVWRSEALAVGTESVLTALTQDAHCVATVRDGRSLYVSDSFMHKGFDRSVTL